MFPVFLFIAREQRESFAKLLLQCKSRPASDSLPNASIAASVSARYDLYFTDRFYCFHLLFFRVVLAHSRDLEVRGRYPVILAVFGGLVRLDTYISTRRSAESAYPPNHRAFQHFASLRFNQPPRLQSICRTTG